jgi:hypothetical protein
MDEQVRFAERVECGGLAPLRVVPGWQIIKTRPERRQAAALHTLRASKLPTQLKAAVIPQSAGQSAAQDLIACCPAIESSS